jgi:sec-independent protein translocase protein TatA
MFDIMYNIFAWSIGTPELIVILLIALILFGRKLPDVARSLGRSLNEFKKGMKETQDDIDNKLNDKDQQPKP